MTLRRWPEIASKMYETVFQLGAKLQSSYASTFNAAQKHINTVDKDIQKVEKTSEKARKSFLGLGEGASKAFKAAAGVLAGIGIAGMLTQSVELASSLSEVQNVVDTTFGNSSAQIDTWSKSALKSFGLSELQAKQFNGTMGAMLKSTGLTGQSMVDMSKTLAGLSGDMSSFYNISQEEAFEKVRAGISGETEPLKQLGINMSVANLQAYAMSQGIKTSYDKMTQAQQVTLRYNYLLKATKDVQGDFSKTSGGFANQLRLAKTNMEQMGASIASHALPFLSKLLQTFNNYASIDTLNKAFSSIVNTIKQFEPLKNIVQGIFSGHFNITDWMNAIKLVEKFGFSNKTAMAIVQTFTRIVVNLKDGIGFVTNMAKLFISIFTGKFDFGPWESLRKVFIDMGMSGSKATEATQSITRGILALKSAVMSYIGIMRTQFKAEINTAINIIKDIAPKLLSFGKSIASSIMKMLPSIIKIVQSISKAFVAILPTIRNVINFIVKTVLPPLSAAFNVIATEVVPAVAKVFQTWMPKIAEFINNLWIIIKPILYGFIQEIKMVAAVIYNHVKGVLKIVGDVVGPILDILNGLVKFIAGVFSGDWKKAWEGIRDIVGGVFGSLAGIVKAPINAIITLVNDVISGIGQLNIKIPDWVPGLGGKEFGLHIPKIPMLENGGYIQHRPGGILANIGEGKEDEVVTPLSKLKGMMNSSGGRIVYNPQIIIQGNASKEDVQEALDISQAKFNRMMDKYFKNKNRVAFD